MNDELHDLLHRWQIGTLGEDGLRRLNDLLDTPEARAVLHDEWFLDATLPEALAALPAWKLQRPSALPQPTRQPAPVRWRLTPAHWSALGAAAVITLACLLWEHVGTPPEEPEVFVAHVAAASLEP
jgi:hypothetical protein